MSRRLTQISQEERHRMMVSDPVRRLILRMAIPTVASQLISVIYNTADTYFVSRLHDHSASAAVGVVFSLMSVIQAFGFGIGMGVSSLISTKLGEKKDREVSVYASSSLAAAVLVGVAIMVLGLPLLSQLMRLLGATETILPYARAYGRYILMGAPLMCASFVLNAILRAEGEARLSMIGLCTGGVLNILLDPLLIFKANMGITGAAVATVSSQMASFLILLSFFLFKRSNIRLGLSAVSTDPRCYGEIIRRGIPTVCRQGVASIATASLNTVAGAVGGDVAIASMTVANKLYTLVRNVIVGIGQGFQPVAGYNFGAGEKGRVRKAFWFTTALGSGICLLASILFFPLAETLIALFYNDPPVVSIGAEALRFTALVLPTMAYSTYVNQLYQCLGYSGIASFLASCRQGIFFLPVIWLLPRVVGLAGVTAAQPLADLVTCLVSIYFHVRFFKRVLRVDP